MVDCYYFEFSITCKPAVCAEGRHSSKTAKILVAVKNSGLKATADLSVVAKASLTERKCGANTGPASLQ